jgi:uncharacterized protein (DUF885 family)
MSRLALALALAVGCTTPAPPPAPAPAAEPDLLAEAVVGVDDPALRRLLDAHWRGTLERSPEWATSQGHEAYAGRLSDPSPAATKAWFEAQRGWLAEARALATDGLSPTDRVTLRLFVAMLKHEVAAEVCRFDTWSLSARSNAYTDASSLHLSLPVTSEARADATIARLDALPQVVRQQAANLRAGFADGAVSNAASVQRIVDQIAAGIEAPPEQWPLWQAVATAEGLADGDRAAFADAVRHRIDGPIRTAFREYLAVLRDEVLPAARPDDRAGLAHLPFGAACYAARVPAFTTLPERDAESLHQLGLDELAQIHAEFAVLGEKVLGTSDRAEIFQRLRTDPALYFATEDEVQQAARDALAKAQAAMPRFFGRLPKRECVVERMPAHEAPFSTIAYYRQPTADRPGTYTINTYAPTTRPRYEAEVLAFHESIPGHHLQIAIAQELDELPAFRRHDGQTVFVEGWALYTERLSDEMGLYSGDLDRLGVLSFDAWRASRLVVDTGIHHKGWSRAQAEAFMAENSPLALNNISNEVDRYITWPGQALAYKTGHVEIRRLRAEAEATLGERFDLPGFHDVVLGGGAVSLPVLRDNVAGWVASRQAAEAP